MELALVSEKRCNASARANQVLRGVSRPKFRDLDESKAIPYSVAPTPHVRLRRFA